MFSTIKRFFGFFDYFENIEKLNITESERKIMQLLKEKRESIRPYSAIEIFDDGREILGESLTYKDHSDYLEDKIEAHTEDDSLKITLERYCPRFSIFVTDDLGEILFSSRENSADFEDFIDWWFGKLMKKRKKLDWEVYWEYHHKVTKMQRRVLSRINDSLKKIADERRQ